jgi:hypothetical protein
VSDRPHFVVGHEAKKPELGGSSPTSWPPGALDPVRVERDRIVALHPDGSVARTKPVRDEALQLQDAVLRAHGGPVWLIIVNGEVHEHLGEHSAYEQACDKMVADGLLTKGHVRAGRGRSYTFTARGHIARWALSEYERIESDRRTGRAA